MNALPERIGPYRILRPIGKGGFGEVFAAVHEHMGLHVALKVLKPEVAKDPDTEARFIREARALARFGKHPGIVQVHHFDRPEGGVAYLAMELLEGQTLRKWLREQNGLIPLESALSICRQIATIMIDVHAQSFVHRDLKPENIMMVPDEGELIGYRPKILDFGIAKAPEPAFVDGGADTHIKTSGHNVLGTKVYMAPEQFKNADNITDKADIYVLGLVVYELLAGKPPFESDDEMELVMMHGRDIPKHLDDLVPTVPPKLATFVASMLAKVPEERPSMRDCRDMFARDWTREHAECPFPGLQPFKDSQSHLFFGRRAETQAIRAKLEEIRDGTSRRWLQIQGPSGTGKSSLVHAAILPSLMASKQWNVITLRPADDPIRSLAAAFAKAYEQNEVDVTATFREKPGALDAFVKKHLSGDTKVLLVIDQFEELFALGSAQVPTIEKMLAKIFENADSPLRILTTIRSDYLHRFDHALGLAKLLDTHAFRYDLRPMDEAALAEVIGGMAARAGLRLADGLAQEMVRDAAGTEYRLPLLGHALRSLWYLRGGGNVSRDHYTKMGGVGGALANHAERLLASLSDEGRERAKWLVLDLVQLGQGAPDTRRPRTRAEVMRAAERDEQTEDAWMRLSGVAAKGSDVDAFRLLVISGDSADPDQQRVDLVHEMVLHKVPIVVKWLHEERQFLELLEALESAALTSYRAEKKDGLPSGTLLDHYRGGKDPARRARLLRMASVQARAFLDEATRLERRQRRIWMAIGTAMLVAVVAIVVSIGIAWNQKRVAEKTMRTILELDRRVIDDLDWELGWRPNTAGIREETLEGVDKKLESLEIDAPLAVRRSIVETKHRRSDFSRTHSSLAVSRGFLAEAQRRIEVGLQDEPSSPEILQLLAMHRSKRGKLLLIEDKHAEALNEFVQSVAIYEGITGTPNFDEQALATSYLERGDAELFLHHEAEALDCYDKAIAARQKIAEKTGESYWQAMVADALTHKANAAHVLKDRKGEEAILKEAFRIQNALAQKEAFNDYYAFILAKIVQGRATTLLDDKQWDEAAKRFTEARDVAARIHAGDKKHKEYALLLIESLMGLESVARESAHLADADDHHKQWQELAHSFAEMDPQDRRFQKLLGN